MIGFVMFLMCTSDASTAWRQRIERAANHNSLIRSPRQRLRIIECTSNIHHLVRRATALHSPLHSSTRNTLTHTRRHVLYDKASVGHGPARYVAFPRHSSSITTATRRLTVPQRDRPPPSSLSVSPMPPSFPPRAQSPLLPSLRSPAWYLAHPVRRLQ